MFKNIIIAILAVATVAFAYIAIRNSEPINCDHIEYTDSGTLCIIELGNVQAEEAKQAMQLFYEKQQYINE